MKTVGILTFYKANNYGVCLQAIATYKFIENSGYQAEIIGYDNPFEHASQRWSYRENGRVLGYVTSFAKNLLLGKMRYFRRGFRDVTHHLKLSERRYSSVSQMNRVVYDVLVAGSDQIWNPQITGGLDDAFLLQFGKAGKRISVASSLGSRPLDEREKAAFRAALEHFSAVSVRENFARDQLQGLTEKPIKVLMDPTFLFAREDWIQMLGEKSLWAKGKERYILCYFISADKAAYQPRVEAYARKLGLPIWTIQFSNYRWKVSSKRILGATVEDFIALFASAELILTDSFHGTAFALNLCRNFVPFRHSGNPIRIINLLNCLGLDSRLDLPAQAYTPVDYADVLPKMNVLREDSRQWVRSALED